MLERLELGLADPLERERPDGNVLTSLVTESKAELGDEIGQMIALVEGLRGMP